MKKAISMMLEMCIRDRLKANSISRDGVGFVAVHTVELDGLAVDINLVVGNMNLTDAHTVRNSLVGRVQHKGI